MNKNSITVILTTYNRKYELRRAIDSLYAQTYRPDEILVIDDNSIDGSMDYIQSFGYEGLKYYYLDEHQGCGYCRNYGIQKANSEWIAFLDSDNSWKTDKLAKSYEKMSSDYDVIWHPHGKHYRFDIIELPFDRHEDFRSNILIGDIPDASAMVFQTGFLERVNGFSERLNTNLDWEMFIRTLANGIDIHDCFIAEQLSENHTMHDSLEENLEQWIADRATILNSYNTLFENSYDKGRFIECFCRYLNIYGWDSEGYGRLIESIEKSKEWIIAIYDSGNKDLVSEINRLNASLVRKNSFYGMLRKWLQISIKEDNLGSRIKRMGYSSIGIYGAGVHGKLFAEDIKRSDVRIACWIEQNRKDGVYSVDDEIPIVDAIIVTPYLEYQSIRQVLENHGVSCPILSLLDLIEME